MLQVRMCSDLIPHASSSPPASSSSSESLLSKSSNEKPAASSPADTPVLLVHNGGGWQAPTKLGDNDMRGHRQVPGPELGSRDGGRVSLCRFQHRGAPSGQKLQPWMGYRDRMPDPDESAELLLSATREHAVAKEGRRHAAGAGHARCARASLQRAFDSPSDARIRVARLPVRATVHDGLGGKFTHSHAHTHSSHQSLLTPSNLVGCCHRGDSGAIQLVRTNERLIGWGLRRHHMHHPPLRWEPFNALRRSGHFALVER